MYIVGINHFDPLMRAKLRAYLLTLNNGPPAFVAVEWDEVNFEKVRRQRPAFRAMISNEFPSLPSSTLEELTNCLGYEADTHRGFWPAVEVLWLDSGRNGDLDNYAKDRWTMYVSFLQGYRGTEMMQVLSDVATRRASTNPTVSSRDRTFADMVVSRASQSAAAWALVIVGAHHAGTHSGSMVDLIRDQAVTCEVKIL